MTMDELTTYNNSYYDNSEIARALVSFGDLPTEATEPLIEVLYSLQAHAQNSYNDDYWRVLYNALCALAERNEGR